MIAQVNYSTSKITAKNKQQCGFGKNKSLPKITKHSTFLENAGVAKGFRKHFPNSEAREMGVSE
jgi:hypothetical protein